MLICAAAEYNTAMSAAWKTVLDLSNAGWMFTVFKQSALNSFATHHNETVGRSKS
jgi:NAD(P)H-dependent FMN reductase